MTLGAEGSEPRSPKKILVLGATGGTGQQVVSQALQRGHDVTVLVRTRQRLTITDDRLRVVAGSVTDDSQALAVAVRDQAAVISTLGAGRSFKAVHVRLNFFKFGHDVTNRTTVGNVDPLTLQ